MECKRLMTGTVLGAALSLLVAFPAAAQIGSTVKAGFTDLPLRTCEGVTAGTVRLLPQGQALKILWDNKNNWAWSAEMETPRHHEPSCTCPRMLRRPFLLLTNPPPCLGASYPAFRRPSACQSALSGTQQHAKSNFLCLFPCLVRT